MRDEVFKDKNRQKAKKLVKNGPVKALIGVRGKKRENIALNLGRKAARRNCRTYEIRQRKGRVSGMPVITPEIGLYDDRGPRPGRILQLECRSNQERGREILSCLTVGANERKTPLSFRAR